jgi:hypothetical protein
LFKKLAFWGIIFLIIYFFLYRKKKRKKPEIYEVNGEEVEVWNLGNGRQTLTPPKTRQYFDLIKKMEKASTQQEKYKFAQMNFALVPEFVKEVVDDDGEFVLRIPSIEFLTTFLQVRGDRKSLQKLKRDLFSVKKWIKPWIEYIEDAIKKIDKIETIIDFLRENPGFIQSKIGKTIGINQKFVSWYLYLADKNNLIKREKSGRSYKVYLV